MAVFLVNSYDINNKEVFEKYPPKVAQILKKYGAEVLVSDTNAVALEGKAKTMNAIIRFPSEEAVHQCYNDPEYEEAKKIRWASTSNCTMILVKEFVIKVEQ